MLQSAKTPPEDCPTFSSSSTTPDRDLEGFPEGSLGKHWLGTRPAADTPGGRGTLALPTISRTFHVKDTSLPIGNSFHKSRRAPCGPPGAGAGAGAGVCGRRRERVSASRWARPFGVLGHVQLLCTSSRKRRCCAHGKGGLLLIHQAHLPSPQSEDEALFECWFSPGQTLVDAHADSDFAAVLVSRWGGAEDGGSP